MRLSSVRSLKDEFKEEAILPAVLGRAAGPSARTRAFARRADAMHTREPKEVAIALGVVPGKSKTDFRLGARINASKRRGRALASDIRRRTRGECDVRVVPKIIKRHPTPAWFQRKQRPLEAGLSVGHFDISAGTIGFIVEDKDAFYVLSNNHVLADVNAGQPGDLVSQPGPADRDVTPATVIGVLDRFVPLSFRRSNVVDCAIAEIREDIEFFVGWTEAIPGVVTGLSAVTVADLGRPVAKAGRTTGVTRGIITQVEVDRLRVDMGEPGVPRVALFSDQFEVQGDDGKAFSLPGDSGSLIVDARGRARGLLFAGGEDVDGVDLTFANRIETVLQKLGVKLTL